MAFGGYLISNSTGGAANAFPMKYIAAETWEISPQQREEIKAYRDDNTRNLTRVTAAGMKTAITFQTIDGLTNSDMFRVLQWFYSNEITHKERNLVLEYWDDYGQLYKTGTFYRANPHFTIDHIDGTTIYYKSLTVELVEY